MVFHTAACLPHQSQTHPTDSDESSGPSWIDSLKLAGITIKTSPSEDVSETFVACLKPAQRRAILAAHEVYRRDDHQVKTPTSINTSASAMGHHHLHPSGTVVVVMDNNKKRKRQLVSQQLTVQAPLCIMPNPSSIYSKFINELQRYYNDHDVSGIVSCVLYPCCSPDVERTLLLWASSTAYTSHSSSIATASSPLLSAQASTSVLLASRSMIGLGAVEASYNHIFHKLPDAMVVYDSSFTKQHLINGETIIKVPCTLFFTIPRLSIPSAYGQEVIYREIRVELHSFSVITFSSQDVIQSAKDHFVEIAIDDPRINAHHVLKFLGFM